jgi:ubiquinone/menaquinone biosynthesis C-methylase UbiE
MTDLNPPFLDRLDIPEQIRRSSRVSVQAEDASNLSFPDNSFDRVIAAHVLEHLANPHEVLREWVRVLKPDGTLSLVLPCDPGVGWRLGRNLFARRNFIKAGLDYDYWMAREHVNPINNLVAFVRHYFSSVEEKWLPSRVPSMDLNLFYICHIKV